MKFLFIIQGEGRGHLMQSIALKDILNKNGHKVVSALIGKSKRRELPDFFTKRINVPIEYFNSPNFSPSTKHKKANILSSTIYNLFKLPTYFISIYFIRNKIKRLNVDVVINFYEIIVGLTYAIFPIKTPYVSIAHQYLLLHPEYKFPPGNKLELTLLRFFTQLTCIKSSVLFALSIKKRKNPPKSRIIIVPPLLREEIFQCFPTKCDYLHGYILNDNLANEIIEYQKKYPYVHLHFFWDKKNTPKKTIINKFLTFHTLNDKLFIKYMTRCKAYATTAGFESICEAMYLGKPILMVPTHIEQSCNAYEAFLAGAGIISNYFDLKKLIDYIPKHKENIEFRIWVQHSEKYWTKELDKFTSTLQREK
ncbi:MAG: glycosyltransferase family protein [Candidatus Azobacteroides pseudotrichonymphae]|jgi:uncharacterized protein (TIGR00661 family)|nr:MAG: glycosyltransferase family protein [Candidatus Azobacteroides pseudotrichonymphae]